MYALGPGRELDKTYIAQGKVRTEWRHLAFLGPESVWAAEASECANEQGRFWDYHDKLFAEQAGENRGTFSKANLKRFAGQIGLDTARFGACLDTDRYATQVQEEKQTAQRLSVAVTPTLFVNGAKIEGVPTWDQLQLAIESAAAGSGR